MNRRELLRKLALGVSAYIGAVALSQFPNVEAQRSDEQIGAKIQNSANYFADQNENLNDCINSLNQVGLADLANQLKGYRDEAWQLALNLTNLGGKVAQQGP